MQTKTSFNKISRALRLPFAGASVLPFLFGSLIEKRNFDFSGFIFGLFVVLFTHLSANLINDYYDSKNGVDWKDRRFYGFFGGSKLIQEGVLPERFYLKGAILCAILALFCVISLAFILRNVFAVFVYLLVIILSLF